MSEAKKEYTDIGEFISDCPIPEKWKREALPLFLSPHDMGRIFALYHLYEQILPIHGDIFEFGVGHGRDMNVFGALRTLLEPSVPRRFIGFDTFDGLREEDITEDDGPKAKPGYCATEPEYPDWLAAILNRYSDSHPSSDKRPFVLVKGKVQDTLPDYLDNDPTAIALAFMDLLIYEPTHFVLERIKERLVKGSVVAFNQFHTPYWRNEARAFHDVFGIEGRRILRNPFHRYWAYFVVE